MAAKATSDGSETNSWTIIWLDSNVNGSEENQTAQGKLGERCDYFRAFETTADCDGYVRSYPNASMVLIVSGRLSREIIPKVEELKQISAIFIYCMDASRHTDWAKQHPKVKGIPVRLEELLSGLQSHQNEPKPVASPPPPPKSKKVKKHPLDGYEKIPLIPLDKSAAPLSRFVPDLDQMVWTVKSNCENPPEIFDKHEAAAIMLYTMTWTDGEASFARILNETIAANEHVFVQQWYPYIRLLLHALSKLPDVSRAVYRSAQEDLSGAYPKDKIIDDWQFSTCTSSIKSLEKEKAFGAKGARTLFTMECRTGKDISKYSYEADRDTILLLPGRRWKVISCLFAGDNLHIIQMQEIEDLLKS